MKLNPITILLAVALSFITSRVGAQVSRTDSTVIFFAKTQIDSAFNPTMNPEKVGRLLGSSKNAASYLVVVRTKPGDVEIHEHWDDVVIIQSGGGVLRTGRVAVGQKSNGVAPFRDWMGGEIKDVKERNLSPGDFIVIPAMMPHQYIPKRGQSLAYWTIKVPKPQ